MRGAVTVHNFLAGPTPALVWAMYADVADYGEWKFGRRSTALVFSAAINQPLTPETLSGIRIMFCIVPGVLAVANDLVLLGYRLTDAKVAEIENELATRRLAQP